MSIKKTQTKYEVIVYREALDTTTFGESPTVGIRIGIQQADETILQERNFEEKWVLRMGAPDLARLSMHKGYQYDPIFDCR